MDLCIIRASRVNTITVSVGLYSLSYDERLGSLCLIFLQASVVFWFSGCRLSLLWQGEMDLLGVMKVD